MDYQDQTLTKKQRRELRRQEKMNQRQREVSKKKIKNIVIWVIVILVLGGGIYGLTLLSDSDSSHQARVTAVNDSDHIKGNPNAEVILIEYSDFQCPACASYQSTIKQLAEEFNDSVQIIYRHFPLRQIHQNAQKAAQAAEAAGLQGKFWEMHDKLFEEQTSWADESDPTDTFVSYAEALELDVDQFKADMDSDTAKNKVNNDYTSGTGARVNSTPTFFLNGEKISNPRGIDKFREVLQEAIGISSSEIEEVTSEEVPNESVGVENSEEATE